jgi:hypothetical protein
MRTGPDRRHEVEPPDPRQAFAHHRKRIPRPHHDPERVPLRSVRKRAERPECPIDFAPELPVRRLVAVPGPDRGQIRTESRLTRVEEQLASVRTDIRSLKTDIHSLKEAQTRAESRLTRVEEQLVSIRTDIHSLTEAQARTELRVAHLEGQLVQLNLIARTADATAVGETDPSPGE